VGTLVHEMRRAPGRVRVATMCIRRGPGHRVDLAARVRLLVLGGTKFLGRHLVEVALARGDEVTLFNRPDNPELFPGSSA